MVQYVDSRTALAGQVRRVILVHTWPADASATGPERLMAAIDLLEHVVVVDGVIRQHLAPRTTRVVQPQEMTEADARHVAEAIARLQRVAYVCMLRDPPIARDPVIHRPPKRPRLAMAALRRWKAAAE